ncbi:E3 ubiquitin-protein ligase RNF125 [Emydura macquarii macquarii]|uniref:E3 ubiquitin-protein ligase RNF125 n=1 Tax=Emydura macquarii macquarii TaxID=1129001 RepID=UPI00352BA6A3
MGSVLSSDSWAVGTAAPRCSLDLGRAAQQQQRVLSFDCAICLEVLNQPVRTQCGHVYHEHIGAEHQNEGMNLGKVCLSEMRIHLRTCEEYIEKYGPLQEFGDTVARYACPFCQCELHEDDLMDHCLTYHRTERRAVYCPICRLISGGELSYFSRNFIKHLQLRHTFYYEDYIAINKVEEALIENVLDQSFLEYVHVNHPNST